MKEVAEIAGQLGAGQPPRFQPYPEYRESGVAWLGAIPAHWEVKPVKAALIRNDSGVWGEDFDDDGTIVLRSTEQTAEGQWRIEGPARRRLSAREAAFAKLCVGDLVVTKSSGSAHHIGKTSVVDARIAALNCCYSNFMQRLRVSAKHVPQFFWYFMNCPAAREQLVFFSSTTTGLGNLNGSILGGIHLPTAPRGEQRAIADFLDRETAKIDALVEKKERLIELLQEKRTALITRAVTRGLDPNAPMKDSGVEWLGEIPAHWDQARLRRLCTAISGATPARENPAYWNGEIPWVSPKDMKRRVVASSEDLITQQAIDETGIRLITPRVVLVVVRGMILAHSFPVAETAAPITINQDMKALSLVDGVDPSYFAWALDGLARGILATVVDEAAHGTRVIRMDQWRNVVCPVPPYSEQHDVACFLESETNRIDALITKIHRAIDQLKEYRTALISAAVTGKIDVRKEAG